MLLLYKITAEKTTVISAVTRFIGVVIFGGNFCVADFNRYCSGKIKGNINFAGYSQHLVLKKEKLKF